MAEEPIPAYEYLRTPEVLLPQELVYGYVREAAAPTAAHQRTVGALFIRLSQHLLDTGAGEAWLSPLDVVLDVERNLVVQPDLSVVLTERADIVSDRIWGAPDLVVEVLSPRPRLGLPAEAMAETHVIAKAGSIEERLEWFATYGVRECWLVHVPGTRIEVIRFQAGLIVSTMFAPANSIRSSVLPDLRLTPLDLIGR
jgi:Uma2 family endonuclease